MLIFTKVFCCCVAIEQYDGMVPMAINGAQYDGSKMCGACVEGTGTGKGAGADPITGTFRGFIMDQCPGCSFGVSFSFLADFPVESTGAQYMRVLLYCPNHARYTACFCSEP